MKILWTSNAPWAGTGYGGQTALFTSRLQAAGHDVAILAFYGMEGGIGEWNGMTVYPTDHTRFGKYFLPHYAAHHGGGDASDVLVITLNDLWAYVDTRIGGIVANTKGLNLASWLPVDHDPVSPKTLQAIDYTKTLPIAMSKFGKDRLDSAGFLAEYVPHGVDTNVFTDRSEDRTRFRAALGIDEDRFVIGMVANNQGTTPPRKAFPQVLQAFRQFLRSHPDALLYLHTDVMGLHDGMNLLAFADICGIPGDSIATCDQFKYHIGDISPTVMSHVYSAMDVLVNPSYGEGFGIPIIEAQACGTPVIVTNWTAMPELVKAGWTVEGDAWYDAAHGSFYMCPSVVEIYDKMEEAYKVKGDVGLRKLARDGIAEYDADHVFQEHWMPVIDKIENPPQPHREVMPLVPMNREGRRAAAKAAGRKS